MSDQLPKQIFLSYSRHDEKIVSKLKQNVEACLGKKIIYQDVDDLKLGVDWKSQLQEAIMRADMIIVYWCCHSAASAEVKDEFEFALKNGKNVMPIMLDDTTLHAQLSRKHGLDFKDIIKHYCNKQSKAKNDWKFLGSISILLISLIMIWLLSVQPETIRRIHPINPNIEELPKVYPNATKSVVIVILIIQMVVVVIFVFTVLYLTQYFKRKRQHKRAFNEMAEQLSNKLLEKLYSEKT